VLLILVLHTFHNRDGSLRPGGTVRMRQYGVLRTIANGDSSDGSVDYPTLVCGSGHFYMAS
jgi:hypothetical protein